MSNTPHELHEEFPAEADKIHALKVSNTHFARLADEYHEINRQVHRAETGVEPVDQFAEVEMRKKRAALKDEIYRMLGAA
ncbi:YdcH family protein [Albidovulum sp.]|uniref:YdcH family protein n=1 Tax=Albidovulum sp. TaxID=1872424 RepID=UPI0039B882D2